MENGPRIPGLVQRCIMPSEVNDSTVNWPGPIEKIYHGYLLRLAGFVRRNLDPRVQVKVDPEEVAHSALKSFALAQAGGRFHLDSETALWALLKVIARRKCLERNKRFMGAKRDVRQERSAEANAREALSVDPSPEQQAIYNDLFDKLFEAADPIERKVCEARLAGKTVPETARELGVSERTVFRNIAYIRERLGRLIGEEPTAAGSSSPTAN